LPGLSQWIKKMPVKIVKQLKILLLVMALIGIVGGIWMIREYLVLM